jgi:hypothetical protein
MITNLLISIF